MVGGAVVAGTVQSARTEGSFVDNLLKYLFLGVIILILAVLIGGVVLVYYFFSSGISDTISNVFGTVSPLLGVVFPPYGLYLLGSRVFDIF